MDLFGYEKYNLFESDCACVAYQIDSAVAIMNLVSNSTNFVPSDTLTLAQSSEWSSEARGGITRLGSSVGCLWITVTALSRSWPFHIILNRKVEPVNRGYAEQAFSNQ